MSLRQFIGMHCAELSVAAAIYMADAHLFVDLFQGWPHFNIYIILFELLRVGHFVLSIPIEIVRMFIVGGLYLTMPLTFLTQIARQIAPGWASLRYLERFGVELKAGAVLPNVLTGGNAEVFSTELTSERPRWVTDFRRRGAGNDHVFKIEDGCVASDIHSSEEQPPFVSSLVAS